VIAHERQDIFKKPAPEKARAFFVSDVCRVGSAKGSMGILPMPSAEKTREQDGRFFIR
jgi:hypothetical protein